MKRIKVFTPLFAVIINAVVIGIVQAEELEALGTTDGETPALETI